MLMPLPKLSSEMSASQHTPASLTSLINEALCTPAHGTPSTRPKSPPSAGDASPEHSATRPMGLVLWAHLGVTRCWQLINQHTEHKARAHPKS